MVKRELELAKGNLLIVDDEEHIRFFLESYLKKHADKIFLAETGLKALEIMETEKIHGIISDLKMPGCDGSQLLEIMKEKKINIPIVMISAIGSTEIQLHCMKNGALDFLPKPFLEGYLKFVTKNMLELGLNFEKNKSLENFDSYRNEKTDELREKLIAFKDTILSII